MAESVERDLELADIYAGALFELAQEAGRTAEVRGELEELVRLEQRQPEFAAFLRSHAIDADRRRESLERMFRGRLSDPVLNTLQVMNQHGRAGLLSALRRAYELRQEHAQGQIEVVATSAVPLDGPHKTQVERWAAEISRKRPLVEYVVDPAIIGGLIVRIGDYRFVCSVRRQLHVIRARLHERSQRGLPG